MERNLGIDNDQGKSCDNKTEVITCRWSGRRGPCRPTAYRYTIRRIMRIPFPCFKCAMKNGTVDKKNIPFIDIQDGILYEGECSQGHKTRATLDQFKHEILFELAIQGIIENYYREAVTNFTGSIERLYEAFIKITIIRKIRDFSVIEDAWKKVNSQSERQLGAFIFLYLNNFGELPPSLSNSQVSFRNDVIHKGKIPTKEETMKYGNDALKVMFPVIKNLMDHFENEIYLYKEAERIIAIGGQDNEVLRIAIGTKLNLTQDYGRKEPEKIEMMVQNYNGDWLRERGV